MTAASSILTELKIRIFELLFFLKAVQYHFIYTLLHILHCIRNRKIVGKPGDERASFDTSVQFLLLLTMKQFRDIGKKCDQGRQRVCLSFVAQF